MTRYRCVDDQKAAGFPVVAACDVMEVSTSAYYAWAARAAQGPSQRELDDAALLDEIRAIHREHPGYGSPRVTEELARRGRTVNHKRVEAMMARHGIVARRYGMRRSLTKPDATAAPLPDLVGRLFDPDNPNHTWCGDITYIPTDEGWLYLASVIDLASRRLIGWSMSDTADTDLVAAAARAAVACRGMKAMPDTIFHSDRGCQYTSRAFGRVCDQLGLRRSNGRTGSCLDNAVAESFFATLKVELVHLQHYKTREEARAEIFRWIHYYNNRRLHSSNGYLTPVEYELGIALSGDDDVSSQEAA